MNMNGLNLLNGGKFLMALYVIYTDIMGSLVAQYKSIKPGTKKA